MEYIRRSKSILTGKENLEPLHTLSHVPVFFGCVDQPPESDVFADQCWAICPETGLVQLDRLIPLEILYQEQHMDGVGSFWKEYYENFAKFISRHGGVKVAEIGGGAGRLAEAVVLLSPNINWTIYEPNPLHPGSDQIKIQAGFFTKDSPDDGRNDTVVFSQVLEHAYDPVEFLDNIEARLEKQGRLVFAYPRLELWLQNKYANALNFEHTMLLTDYFVDVLLERTGFKIIEKQDYRNHSYFYVCEKIDRPDSTQSIKNHYDQYRRLYLEYREYYEDLVSALNAEISKFDGDVYVFGAHIFAQNLFQYGLNAGKITGLLDNSPLKQGRRLYGTTLKVFSPEILRDKPKSCVILKVANFRDEIYAQLKQLAPDIKILE